MEAVWKKRQWGEVREVDGDECHRVGAEAAANEVEWDMQLEEKDSNWATGSTSAQDIPSF